MVIIKKLKTLPGLTRTGSETELLQWNRLFRDLRELADHRPSDAQSSDEYGYTSRAQDDFPLVL